MIPTQENIRFISKPEQRGDHESLSKSEGLYAELWKRQSGGFIE